MNIQTTGTPLLKLFSDPLVTEVMVNRFDSVFVERDGILEASEVQFGSKKDYEDFIFSLLKSKGSVLDHNLCFDGAISGQYRYNIVLPPMNPSNPLLTVRVFSCQKFSLDSLVAKKSLSSKAAHFLKSIVSSKCNIIVSGGTGSGKTTFLQALSSEISDDERIVSIEDVPELNLHQKNWVQLLSVKNGPKKVSIKDCLINSLRMRPDRIVVGECRRDETFEMLQAMNTGHDGSMTTIHGNSVVDCLTRVENLLISAGYEVANKYIRRQISETVDFIVQLGRLGDGSRVVSAIVELTGIEGDMITKSSIFELDANGMLQVTGLVPKSIGKIEEKSGGFPENFWLC